MMKITTTRVIGIAVTKAINSEMNKKVHVLETFIQKCFPILQIFH